MPPRPPRAHARGLAARRIPCGRDRSDVTRFFGAVAIGLFNAAVLWLTYLGLEPYVRRYSPDSLIGWTRAIGGHWRDSRVATDVMIGVSAGLAMTVFYALHNVLPPLGGLPEPMPIVSNTRALLGRASSSAESSARSSTPSSRHALRRRLRRVADRCSSVRGSRCRSGVCLHAGRDQDMFPAGTPQLDLAIGAAIITILILVIVRFGLLAQPRGVADALHPASRASHVPIFRAGAALSPSGSSASSRSSASERCYIARSTSPQLPKMPEMPKVPDVRV